MKYFIFRQSKILMVLLTGFLFCGFISHKYYFSLTDIEYNAKNQSLEIITNVFIDDIELELNKMYSVSLYLNTKKQYQKTDSIFASYFSKNLKIKVDGKTKNFKYLGIEFEEDLVYIYLEAKGINDPKEFHVTNNILYENFEDQQNVVKIKKGKIRKSDILNLKNAKTVLKFDD